MPKGKRRKAASAAKPAGTASSPAATSLSAVRGNLIAQRKHIEQQIAAVDHALKMLGTPVPAAAAPAAAPAKRGPRPGGALRPGSLKDYIRRVLSGGKTLAVKDITAGVVKAGYKSKNKTLAKSVGIALTEMGAAGVKKVGRGLFRIG